MNNENNNIIVDGNEPSIHDFDFALICEYFSSVKRQGPGSDEMTRTAMEMVGGIADNAVVADLGCGCGSQTIQLALGSKAQIKALDLFPLFIDKLKEKCRKAGVADRVEGIVGDMGNLPFEAESLDLIWSEGAIYNIGFERGMCEWRKFLKPDGWIAVSEASWLRDNRPSEIGQFWTEAYPEIDTINNKVEQMMKAGYRDIRTFVLPDECWTTNFYEPQVEAQRFFLERYPDNRTANELVANQRREAELYNRYHDYYGYVFYIGRKA
ncbi:MAG: class I SAM-dependent methyltransferase [Prevotella sp.]